MTSMSYYEDDTEDVDLLVAFDIPSAGPSADRSNYLKIKSLRNILQPRPSPLIGHPSWDSRFVDDDDRVVLNTMSFSSTASSGASGRGFFFEDGETFLDPHDENIQGIQLQRIHANGRVIQRECIRLPPFAIRAGPRNTVYFDPATVNAAILTVGGICPGMNDVIQNMVKRLTDYGVPDGNILGVRYGFQGMQDKHHAPLVLTRGITDGIHLTGGSMLGASPAHERQEMSQVLKRLEMWGINMLFIIGGEGGIRVAQDIASYCQENQLKCAVVGVPKSIDNDFMLIDKSFGFDTTVEEAQRALLAAKVEASSARKGIGLVKLMGRRSGFTAMQASLASGVVDVCLIPEVPFELEGPRGLLRYVQGLLERNGHAVICVAEGAGQDLIPDDAHNYSSFYHHHLDEAGNPVLGNIGSFLKKQLKAAIPDADIKYIDPTYMIRAIPASAGDSIYCKTLATHAVDAAFSGYTSVAVGQVNSHFVFLPMSILTRSLRTVDPFGKMWNRLRASIGQPNFVNSAEGDSPPRIEVVPMSTVKNLAVEAE